MILARRDSGTGRTFAVQSTALQIDARGLAARLARVLWLHRWLLAIIFIYFATGFAVLEYVDRPEKMAFSAAKI